MRALTALLHRISAEGKGFTAGKEKVGRYVAATPLGPGDIMTNEADADSSRISVLSMVSGFVGHGKDQGPVNTQVNR